MSAREIGELVIWIAGVLAAVSLIWHKGIKPPIRFAQRVETAMCRVEHELGNNGGGTLRDHVDRIAYETKILAEQSDLRHQHIENRLTALETHLISSARPTRRKQTTPTGGTYAE